MLGGLNNNPEDGRDYYRGGMAINFSRNPMGVLSLGNLSKIFKIKCLRSVNLSNLTKYEFVDHIKNTVTPDKTKEKQ